jgi:hypothetical protein
MVPTLEQIQPPQSEVIDRIARVAAGSAIAEAYPGSERRPSESTAYLPVLATTLSISLAQAIIAGYPAPSFDWIARQWQGVHPGADNAESSKIRVDQITSMWKIVSDASRGRHSEVESSLQEGSEDAILRFLANAIHGQGLGKELLVPSALSTPLGIEPSKLITSPREERIRAFNEFINQPDRWSRDPLGGQFIAGLLLAIAGNGSFDLLRSGGELLNRSPVSIIWFGICAALLGNLTSSQPLTARGDALFAI